MASRQVTHRPTQNTTAPPDRTSLIVTMASVYGLEPEVMKQTLKNTCFRPVKVNGQFVEVSNEQLAALLIVCREYRLNPFLKEIYAFPDKAGGVVPVVGVDGWTRMMNEHPQFVGQQFQYPDVEDDEIYPWIQSTIWRRDREHPTVAREFFDECKRDNTEPWKTHPRRMLRHKALIQSIRMAFGFSGIKDPDEADRIVQAFDITPRSQGKPATQAPQALSEEKAAPVSAEQLTLIRERLSAAEIPESDAVGQFHVERLEALRFDDVPALLDWIAKFGK